MFEIKHNAKLSGNHDFILVHQAEQVYYWKYPYGKLAAWRVVYKVNPRKWLYTRTAAAYHFDDK
jgi:phage-related protein